MQNNEKKQLTYKDSGVNLDNAGKAIEIIKKSVSSTFSKNVLNDLTSYSGLFSFDSKKYKEPVLVSSTDGVGTKLLIAKEADDFTNIGQDLVGMCINDILCCGAMPLFFLDYIACGHLEPEKIRVVVESIAAACSQCKAALIGGEIAEMPDVYSKDDIDLAGFVVGVVERAKVIKPGMVKKNDIIVGLPSSGVHSNGFSLIRKILKSKNIKLGNRLSYKVDKDTDITLAAELLTPTKLYFRTIKKLLDAGVSLHGIAHITGGGFYENINRIIPKNLNASILMGSWEIPAIFDFLKNAGNIDDREMFRVFNMGIGMILIIDPADYVKVEKLSLLAGEEISRIGNITEGDGGIIINGL